MVKREKKKAARGAKKQFVEALPMDMPTADVVAKARAEGVELSGHQVSNIRWLLKHRDGAAAATLAGPRARTKPAKAAAVVVANNANRLTAANNVARLTASADAERARSGEFRHLVLQLGLMRARTLLDEIEGGEVRR